jgi:hypothetical protein
MLTISVARNVFETWRLRYVSDSKLCPQAAAASAPVLCTLSFFRTFDATATRDVHTGIPSLPVIRIVLNTTFIEEAAEFPRHLRRDS